MRPVERINIADQTLSELQKIEDEIASLLHFYNKNKGDIKKKLADYLLLVNNLDLLEARQQTGLDLEIESIVPVSLFNIENQWVKVIRELNKKRNDLRDEIENLEIAKHSAQDLALDVNAIDQKIKQ